MLSSVLYFPFFTTLALAVDVLSLVFDLATRTNCLHSYNGPYDSCEWLSNLQK